MDDWVIAKGIYKYIEKINRYTNANNRASDRSISIQATLELQEGAATN